MTHRSVLTVRLVGDETLRNEAMQRMKDRDAMRENREARRKYQET